MSKLSQAQKIANYLKANPQINFTAKELANAIVEQHPEDYLEKRKNPRFVDDRAFFSQVVAEIGALKNAILKCNPHIFWRDKPRPRIYWYNLDAKQSEIIKDQTPDDDDEIADKEQNLIETNSALQNHTLSEQQLYPLLVEYLKSELSLFCQRIDEKRSKNLRGNGGNQWLHPDIVAMQPVDKGWDDLIRICVKKGGGQSVRLWSFEVKKELNSSNVRKSFFQAVSNSSWANEGYLVTTFLTDNNVEQELRMLSALHGIGVILLNSENPSESEILLPAVSKSEINWQSVNRIVVENEDFKDFIELVSMYYETGRVINNNWNKIPYPK
jgi:hypothetical protein